MVWKDKLIDFVIRYGFQAAGALAVLTAGAILAFLAGKFVGRRLARLNLEPPVRMLVVRVLRMLILVFTLVIALGNFGVEVGPLVAGIGVVGVGVGLAMQGVLGNLVAGLLIIFTKPFRVGEYIELLDVRGDVVAIELFSTILLHPDRSRVVIPNRKIVGEILHNYGRIRQLDLSVGIAYSADVGAALAAVQGILAANPLVLKDPAPAVGVSALADSAVVLAVRPWVPAADYGAAQAELNLAILETFRARRIEIPFPQMDVHVRNAAGSA